MSRSKMQEIELRYGKTLSEILVSKFEQYGNIYLVADALGVSQGTVSNWLMRCGLTIKSIAVPKVVQSSNPHVNQHPKLPGFDA